MRDSSQDATIRAALPAAGRFGGEMMVDVITVQDFEARAADSGICPDQRVESFHATPKSFVCATSGSSHSNAMGR